MALWPAASYVDNFAPAGSSDFAWRALIDAHTEKSISVPHGRSASPPAVVVAEDCVASDDGEPAVDDGDPSVVAVGFDAPRVPIVLPEIPLSAAAATALPSPPTAARPKRRRNRGRLRSDDGGDHDCNSRLRFAAKRGRVGDVRRWLRDGADVNHLDERTGFGALHHAAWNGHVAVIRVLLAEGADATLCNHMGETAADSARAAGNGAIAARLDESAEGGGNTTSNVPAELPSLPAPRPTAAPTSPPPPPPPPPGATAEETAWRAAFDAALASATPLPDAALAAVAQRLLRALA